MSGDNDEYILTELKHHPRVCSNCFRLRQHESPLPERITRLAQRTIWASALSPMWTRTAEADRDAPPGDTVSDRAPRTVCECGVFHPYAEVSRDADEPLDKSTAIEFAAHISKTLGELSVEAWERDDLAVASRFHHDRDVLFDTVRHLKTQPSEQFKDDLILAAATEVACGYGDTATDEPRERPVQHVDC